MFPSAKTREQPERPSAEEWTEKTQCTHTGVLPKEDEIRPPAASRMGSEITALSEVSHRETSITYLWNLKNDAKEPIYKTKTDLLHRE